MSANRWIQLTQENPGHSAWYVERFRKMAAEGTDLHGEARFVDAMAPRGARILDAGCGPGRVGGRLAELGHRVVGVDLDPELIDAARADHPEAAWVHGDLATVDLGQLGADERFDVVVSAGNVMPFLDPATRETVLVRLAALVQPDGRLAIGFGAGRDYAFDDFFRHAERAGLHLEVALSTWHLHPFTATSDFLVAVFSRRVRE